MYTYRALTPVQNDSVLIVKVLEVAINQEKIFMILKLQSSLRFVCSSNWHPAVISSGALVCRHSSGHSEHSDRVGGVMQYLCVTDSR